MLFFVDRRRKRLALALVLLGVLCAEGLDTPKVSGNEPVSIEYQVKAAFLVNFVKFVEWPPRVFPDPQAPVVIGILGENPFDGALDDVVKNQTVNGRLLTLNS